MEIDSSRRARRFIEKRGGRVYVWFDDFGRSPWLVQRVRFDAPQGVVFSRHADDGVDLYLQADFNPPAVLRIRRRPWPIGPIEVTGTGAGEAYLGSAGGDGWGGDWPSGHGGGHGGGGGGHGGHGGH